MYRVIPVYMYIYYIYININTSISKTIFMKLDAAAETPSTYKI